ncbi:MAG TPA: hypothetical protein VFH99_02295 [Candidatus Saccharimonadales bacterium]|nr:hypothetical protein [Candidatus Saccharimonadales bacterium]
MVHPVGSTETRSASSDSSAHKKTPTSESPSVKQLAPLPMAKTDLPTLPPAVSAGDNSVSNHSVGGPTASPQAAGSSSAKNIISGGNISAPSGSGVSGSKSGLIQTVVNGVLNGL